MRTLVVTTSCHFSGESDLPRPEMPPFLAEFAAATFLPNSEVGPVLSFAFNLFAFICASVAIGVFSQVQGPLGQGISPGHQTRSSPSVSKKLGGWFSFFG